VPLAKAGARIMLGATIAELRAEGMLRAAGDGAQPRAGALVAVKEAVLPFHRFRARSGEGVDCLLGPEMKSTGEVMAIDTNFDAAFAKAQLASGNTLPTVGRIYVSVAVAHLPRVAAALRTLHGIGFEVVTDIVTARLLSRTGLVADAPAGADNPVAVARWIHDRQISLVISVCAHGQDRDIHRVARTAAAQHVIPYVTTVTGLLAMARAIRARNRIDFTICSLQDTHARSRRLLLANDQPCSLAPCGRDGH